MFSLCPSRWPVQRGAGGVGHQPDRRPSDLEDGDDGRHSHRSGLPGNRTRGRRELLVLYFILAVFVHLPGAFPVAATFQWLCPLFVGCFPPNPAAEQVFAKMGTSK